MEWGEVHILVRREEALSLFLAFTLTHCVWFQTLRLELRAERIRGKNLKDLHRCNPVLVLPVLPGLDTLCTVGKLKHGDGPSPAHSWK